MFTNYNCKYKEEIRDLLFGMIVRKFKAGRWYDKDTLNTLTLPAEHFILEKRIREIFPYGRMFTCESNEEVYNKQIKKELFTTHFYGDIDELVYKIGSNRLDFIWLDYCGCLTIKKLKNLDKLFKSSRTDKPQIIAITILGAREIPIVTKTLSERFGLRGTSFKINKKIREILYPKHLADLLGASSHIVRKYVSGKGSPMYTYIFEK